MVECWWVVDYWLMVVVPGGLAAVDTCFGLMNG